MIEVSSWGAREFAPRVKPLERFVGLLSGHKVTATVAVLMLSGCLSLSNSAYAQAASSGSADACTTKCMADRDQCIQDQSSEEMCAYDLKACKKDCEKK
jgi:hypothetical protein